MTNSQLSPFNSPLIPPGYKHTEVGVIPEDWEVKPLKRISPRQSVGLVINPSTYFDKAGTVPLLVGSNVSENAIDSTNANRITKASNELLPASRLVAGDLVTVRVGEPGFTAVVPPELDGCNCASMMIVRQHPSFDSHWLCWMMNSQHGRRQVEHVQYGTAQKQFNISHAVDFLYPVPRPSEQRAIAAALSDVDALLGGLDRLIAKKRDLKQAAMQQLLTGQTRLPGFSGEWELKRLGDLATIKDGTHQTPRYVDSGIPFYSVEHVTSGDFKNTKFISEEEHRFLTLSAKIEKGDILMTRIGSIGDCKLIDWEVEASFYVSLALLKIRPGYSAAFITHYSNTVAFKKEVEVHSLQSAIPKKINLGPISDVQIELPPTLAEQTAIAGLLTEMDAELAALEQRREKTRTLKQAMMQELLTGRIRLVESGKLKVESENSVKT